MRLDKILKELKESEKRQKQLEKKEKKVCSLKFSEVLLIIVFLN